MIYISILIVRPKKNKKQTKPMITTTMKQYTKGKPGP